MLIREVLELTQHKPLAEIARDHLRIGEKTARKALNRAGATSTVGKAGWYLDDFATQETLDISIYEFAEQVKRDEASALKAAANVETYVGNGMMIPRKRFSFDLDVRLVKELKLRCVREDKKLYEAVEEAIRTYLEEDEAL